LLPLPSLPPTTLIAIAIALFFAISIFLAIAIAPTALAVAIALFVSGNSLCLWQRLPCCKLGWIWMWIRVWVVL
jgi:hypothetical protein